MAMCLCPFGLCQPRRLFVGVPIRDQELVVCYRGCSCPVFFRMALCLVHVGPGWLCLERRRTGFLACLSSFFVVGMFQVLQMRHRVPFSALAWSQ